MRRSLKERTLVGTTKTYWQEVDEYYRKNGRPMRLDDVNDIIENKRSIEQAVGRLFDKDLEIPWYNVEAKNYKDAMNIVSELPKGWESMIESSFFKMTNASWIEHDYENYRYRYYRLQVRPTEIRECEWRKEFINVEYDSGRCRREMINEVKHYNDTLRDKHGNLRPIIENWPAVRDAAMRFIRSVIKK